MGSIKMVYISTNVYTDVLVKILLHWEEKKKLLLSLIGLLLPTSLVLKMLLSVAHQTRLLTASEKQAACRTLLVCVVVTVPRYTAFMALCF